MVQKVKNIFHLISAIIAVIINGYPARKLKVIGVTGTDGKTTTSTLIYHILTVAGLKASLITSVSAKIGDKEYDTGFHVTTPNSFALQKFIKKAKKIGSEYLVLETTSHGLDQNRVFGCNYLIGVITNVTHEHLDYHKTYENYVKTKAKLFKKVKFSIINIDDKSYDYLKKHANGQIITYGLNRANYNLKNFKFQTKLPGTYNKYNCLAAIAATKSLEIPDPIIKKALISFKPVIGRMEEIKNNLGFKTIVDFAHTPYALENALKAGKSMLKGNGKLISVFGSAGLRDVTKRPLMGQAAAKHADIIILTAEDPRTEDVNDIIEQIAKGIKGVQLYKIPDRQGAMSFAVKKIAKPGDVIMFTGKGHERSMCYGKTETPWNEHEAVKKTLKK